MRMRVAMNDVRACNFMCVELRNAMDLNVEISITNEAYIRKSCDAEWDRSDGIMVVGVRWPRPDNNESIENLE